MAARTVKKNARNSHHHPVALCSAIFLAISALQSQAAEDIQEIVVVGDDYLTILPSASTPSVFGMDKPMTEIPRSVTEVRQDLIENFALRSVDDLVRLTPGAFTSSFFGIRGAMDIRGEPADNYYRGFKRIANPGAFNTIVRGAEKLEILRGPVSPLYGSGSVGGQLNYTPKSNQSDAAMQDGLMLGDVNVTLGSYNQRIVSGNLGSPLGFNGGMHIFAEVEDSESFYDLYEPSSKLLQLAFNFELGASTTLEFGGQYQTSDSIQVPGWNRVTQALIDDGTYITGAPPVRNTGADPVQLLPQESGFISTDAGVDINNSFSNVGTFCVPDLGFNNGVTYNGMPLTCFGGNETPWISPLTNSGTAKLDHDTTFIDTIDFADSTAVTVYADITHEFSESTVWKTEFFHDYMDHHKFQSWGFTADYPEAILYEFRTSLQFAMESGGFSGTNFIGLNYRIEDLELKHAFFDETFDFRDLTVGPTPDDRIAPAVNNPLEGVTFSGGVVSSGTVQRNYNLHEISTNTNTGLFFLSDMAFGSFSLLVGGRYDLFDVESEDIGVTLANIRFDSIQPWQGKQSDTTEAFSYNLSLSYKFESGFIPYFTYAESNSLSTNQLGGISPSTVLTGSYLQESSLYEAGLKWDGLDGLLFAAVTYYDQEKVERTGQTQALTEVFGKGYEFELRAVVTDELSVIATATHTETTEIGDAIFTVVNAADFAAENGLDPADLYGGRIAGDRATFVGTGTELDRGGLPDNIFSLYGTYKFFFDTSDLTASLGFTWVDETYIDVFESVLLPDYMVWTGSLRYMREQFSALLQVNNLFEEEYYTSADLFDSVIAKPSEGRTLSLTLSYSF